MKKVNFLADTYFMKKVLESSNLMRYITSFLKYFNLKTELLLRKIKL